MGRKKAVQGQKRGAGTARHDARPLEVTGKDNRLLSDHVCPKHTLETIIWGVVLDAGLNIVTPLQKAASLSPRGGRHPHTLPVNTILSRSSVPIQTLGLCSPASAIILLKTDIKL